MENHNKLKELNTKFKKFDEEIQDADHSIYPSFRKDDLSKKDICVSFFKIFLTSVIGCSLCFFLMTEFIDLWNSKDFSGSLIVFISFFGYISFGFISFAAINRSNIKTNALLYTKKSNETAFSHFIVFVGWGCTTAVFGIIFVLLSTAIEIQLYGTKFMPSFCHDLYFFTPLISNGVLVISSLFHYLTTKSEKEQKRINAERIEHNQKIEDNLNNIYEKLDIVSEEIMEYADKNLSSIHDIEFLDVFIRENDLEFIFNHFEKIKNNFANKNGFKSLSEMKCQDIKNKEANLRYMIND